MSFHVPPERYRETEHPRCTARRAPTGNNGAFLLASPEPGWQLFLLCSDGEGWEHVSLHARRARQQRTPSWREMAFVKDLCWDDEDVVVQFHPRRSEYVNNHPHVLHLWRPVGQAIPTPPPLLVGVLT